MSSDGTRLFSRSRSGAGLPILVLFYIFCLFFPYAMEKYHRRVNDLLIKSARKGNIADVKHWLGMGADIDAKGFWGKASIHLAAERNNLEMLTFLLERGADLHATSMSGEPPLKWTGDLECAKLLIEHGAEVNLPPSQSEYTLVQRVAVLNKLGLLKLYIANGVIITEDDIFIAVREDKPEALRILLDSKEVNDWDRLINAAGKMCRPVLIEYRDRQGN